MTILFVKIFQIMMERDPLVNGPIILTKQKFANIIAINSSQLKVVLLEFNVIFWQNGDVNGDALKQNWKYVAWF